MRKTILILTLIAFLWIPCSHSKDEILFSNLFGSKPTPEPVVQRLELVRTQKFDPKDPNKNRKLNVHMDIDINDGNFLEYLGKKVTLYKEDANYLKELIVSDEVKKLPTYTMFLSNQTTSLDQKDLAFTYSILFHSGQKYAAVIWETGTKEKLPLFCSTLETYFEKYKKWVAYYDTPKYHPWIINWSKLFPKKTEAPKPKKHKIDLQ